MWVRDPEAMKRAYFDAPAASLANADPQSLLGALAQKLPFALEPTQRQAWLFEIQHLQALARDLPGAHFFLEFLIPRMGRRADAIILYKGIVYVVEYKVGEQTFTRSALDQTLGYALDLKNFHETSHHLPIVPVLVATNSLETEQGEGWSEDRVRAPACTNAAGLTAVICAIAEEVTGADLGPGVWAAGRYKPTPTIVEAAQALYRGHDVGEISRSEAGAENLTTTSAYVEQVIESSKEQGRKTICFITGVPGSGKTLAGLSIANDRMRSHDDEHAVFLSGNGPLVTVLREALTLDAIAQKKAIPGAPRPSKAAEYQKACAFIQNIHHFRDDNLVTDQPPIEKVVVFDEAQRAWNVDKASQFMRERGHTGFSMSEPQFLLSVMDRHDDWCTVVALIGGGQEINTGEAGLVEWLEAIAANYPEWEVHLPEQILGREYLGDGAGEHAMLSIEPIKTGALHLTTSVRSFRAEKLSEFVGAIIDGDAPRARELIDKLSNYPIVLTRDLTTAREWLRQSRRGPERAGLLASSNAMRLKPEGIYVKAKIDPAKWFLAPPDDVRSSDALEDVATEFDVQGLELDWACVCWDANLRRSADAWETLSFSGSAWQRVNDERRRAYLLNSYRVLLTRARQGMVIFVPQGNDEDGTRPKASYDGVRAFLERCGIPAV